MSAEAFGVQDLLRAKVPGRVGWGFILRDFGCSP